MRGISAAALAALQGDHTAVVAVKAIRNGSVVANLEAVAGSVTADRTAAQMRTMQCEVIDRDGTLAPTGMTSTLAPFGTRIQMFRGVRIRNTQTASATYGASGNTSWVPQSTGVMNGVKVDGFGNLALGP